MDMIWLYFIVAGFIAGAMNAIAGGGSFVIFPALILGGLPPIVANQTSSVALLPGAMAGGWGYRSQLKGFKALGMVGMAVPTLIGGGVGAVLLLVTPSSAFNLVIPWLVLFGAFAFAFGKRIAARFSDMRDASRLASWLVVVQLVWGIYGGYFGGAVGIMMMASWTILGIADIQAMNAMKVTMLAAAKLAAFVIFIFYGSVDWPLAAVLVITTIAGGYLGAQLAQLINAERLRRIIVVCFFAIAAVFFIKSYGALI